MNALNRREEKLHVDQETVWQNVCAALDLAIKNYRTLIDGDPVEWTGPESQNICVRVFHPGVPRQSERGDERERVDIVFDREKHVITATYSSGRPQRVFELDVRGDRVVMKYQGKEINAEAVSEEILGPVLFPSLETDSG